MDLVHKQDAALAHIGEQAGQIAGALDDRARGVGDLDAELVTEDRRQRGLAQPWRAVEQDVVQRLAAALGGLEEDA